MPNITITNIDLGSVVLELAAAEDGLLTNGDADPVDFRAGLILARDGTSLKFTPYAPAGGNGSNIPCAVLTYDVLAAPGASDVAVRVLTAGSVNANRLRLLGGIVTAAHRDLLRSFSIIPVEVEQLGVYDNPQA